MSAVRTTCRAEVLEAFRALERRLERTIFSPADIVAEMKKRGTSYPDSTIRTHVCSHMCVDAPDNAAVTYPDLERVSRGRYRRRRVVAPPPAPVRFTVSGLPPKKDNATSMWRKDSEVEQLACLRLAAAPAFRDQPPFAGEVRLTLVVHVGPQNHQLIGRLENMIGGIIGGLQAAHQDTPWRKHAAWQRPEVRGVLPDRTIGLKDSAEVVAIDARKVTGDCLEPWYEVTLEAV